MLKRVGNIHDEDSVLLTTCAALTFFWTSFFHGGVWSQHPEQRMHSRQVRAELRDESLMLGLKLEGIWLGGKLGTLRYIEEN